MTKNGFTGTFVISWTQTATDGQSAPVRRAIRPGAAWRWHGEAVRVDGPQGVMPLGPAEGMPEMRRRAARAVRRLVRSVQTPAASLDDDATPAFEQGFTVTDGWHEWPIAVIEAGPRRPALCLALGQVPPRETDLWITEASLGAREPDHTGPARSVLCFTPGTLIRTATGARPVESLSEGDRVQTMDNGCCPVLWTGQRRITGARLHALPDLAPIRMRAGALGDAVPDTGLLLSPDHRVLLRGRRAQSLFNAPEVLVRAADLVDDARIRPDRGLREVRYIHLALDRHEIVFANGVPCESFHPASVGLGALGDADRQRLLDLVPELAHDLSAFGPFARRMLSAPEAAILIAA
ncbi:Hint domain-containing protein [Histidinibacterium aquaticum]|uniref:Hint domain-containing protein n=1 Tax=Histidinibacterium aquaticum TaxID=2613962 RepID=A0A5J5GJ77_9RHOB|nr:Hint domain-containing protein [Histidinibacterium aquaticum]KAA9008286.1 Hint domain-containing protein [Histidinibacterium aquaticum]